MLCWWAWILYVVTPATDQLVQGPAGNSVVAAVVCVAVPVAAAVCVACVGPDVGESAGVGPDVMAEAGTEQEAGEEAVLPE